MMSFLRVRSTYKAKAPYAGISRIRFKGQGFMPYLNPCTGPPVLTGDMIAYSEEFVKHFLEIG